MARCLSVALPLSTLSCVSACIRVSLGLCCSMCLWVSVRHPLFLLVKSSLLSVFLCLSSLSLSSPSHAVPGSRSQSFFSLFLSSVCLSVPRMLSHRRCFSLSCLSFSRLSSRPFLMLLGSSPCLSPTQGHGGADNVSTSAVVTMSTTPPLPPPPQAGQGGDAATVAQAKPAQVCPTSSLVYSIIRDRHRYKPTTRDLRTNAS